jgi:serine/threonine protein kinase
MADIFEAKYNGKVCAAKVLKNIPEASDPQSKMYRDLVSEINIMASLPPHANILMYYAAITVGHKPVLFMELVKGLSLNEYLHDGKFWRPSNATVAGWTRDLLSAVAHLHDRDPIVVHRDSE